MENKILVDKSILDKLYVTPCLQELKKGFTGNIRAIIQTEPEQQAGIWDKENKQIKKFNQNGIYYNDTSDYFDKLWYDSIKIDNDKYDMITKNNLLDISSWKKYGFYKKNSNRFQQLNSQSNLQQGGFSEMECKYLTRKQKWKMYFNFILEQMKLHKVDNINVIMVSHHNRMKDKIKGLLPFYKDINKNQSKINSYANCFCLKLEIDDNKKSLTKKIINEGYPDKNIEMNYKNKQNKYINKYNDEIINYHNITQSKSEVKEEYEDYEEDYEEEYGDYEDYEDEEISGGGIFKKKKIYNYCGYQSKNDVNTIDTREIESILKELNLLGKKINIYLVRHGNSLHNKPLNIKDGRQLDSCLTPLGIFQAEQTGLKIKKDIQNNSIILPLVSFLRRTQHTCLSILQQISNTYTKLDDTLKTNIINKFIEDNKRENGYYKNLFEVQKEQTTEIYQDMYKGTYEALKININNMISFFIDKDITEKSYDNWICGKYGDRGDCNLYKKEIETNEETRYKTYQDLFNIISNYYIPDLFNIKNQYFINESNIRIDNIPIKINNSNQTITIDTMCQNTIYKAFENQLDESNKKYFDSWIDKNYEGGFTECNDNHVGGTYNKIKLNKNTKKYKHNKNNKNKYNSKKQKRKTKKNNNKKNKNNTRKNKKL